MLLLSKPHLSVEDALIAVKPAQLKAAYGTRADPVRAAYLDARLEAMRLLLIERDEKALRRYIRRSNELERELEGSAIRLNVSVPRETKHGVAKRQERKPRVTPSRSLPSYGFDIIDRQGRRGIYLRLTAATAGKDDDSIGCCRQHFLYVMQEGAVEIDADGHRSVVSNMGDDVFEQGAAWDVLEEIGRACRKNAKLQIRIVLNVPSDLTPAQRLTILKRFCEEAFGQHGLPYAAAVHEPDRDSDDRNFHAHILASFRPMHHLGGGEWEVGTHLRRDLDGPEGSQLMRELAAINMTEVCQEAGKNRIYTGLSYAARGLRLQSTRKLNAAAVEAFRKGEDVAAVADNELIIAENKAWYQAEQDRWRVEDLERLEALGRRAIEPVQQEVSVANGALKAPATVGDSRFGNVPVRAGSPPSSGYRTLLPAVPLDPSQPSKPTNLRIEEGPFWSADERLKVMNALPAAPKILPADSRLEASFWTPHRVARQPRESNLATPISPPAPPGSGSFLETISVPRGTSNTILSTIQPPASRHGDGVAHRGQAVPIMATQPGGDRHVVPAEKPVWRAPNAPRGTGATGLPITSDRSHERPIVSHSDVPPNDRESGPIEPAGSAISTIPAPSETAARSDLLLHLITLVREHRRRRNDAEKAAIASARSQSTTIPAAEAEAPLPPAEDKVIRPAPKPLAAPEWVPAGAIGSSSPDAAACRGGVSAIVASPGGAAAEANRNALPAERSSRPEPTSGKAGERPSDRAGPALRVFEKNNPARLTRAMVEQLADLVINPDLVVGWVPPTAAADASPIFKRRLELWASDHNALSLMVKFATEDAFQNGGVPADIVDQVLEEIARRAHEDTNSKREKLRRAERGIHDQGLA